MGKYAIGVSLGSTPNQYSAIVIMECIEEKPQKYHIVKTERFSLGTSYPDIAGRLKVICDKLKPHEITFVIDETGVGDPIIRMIRDQVHIHWRVTISDKKSATFDEDSGKWTVPKRDLIASLMIVSQSQRYRIAEGLSDAEILARQADKLNANSKVKLKADEDECWRENEDDDYLLAWAAATWAMERPKHEVFLV